MYADLHAHTTASDGTATPTELVRDAVSAGITLLAVTDHDTVAGVAEAQRAAHAAGIRLIPGVELSCSGTPGKCHMLGLGIDLQNMSLVQTLHSLSENRGSRNQRIIERLNALGIAITLQEVVDVAPPGANIGRPHIAQVLVQRGVVRDLPQAFAEYLGDSAPGYVPKAGLSPADAIALIHGAGGLAVLAHPGLIRLAEQETMETRLSHLKAAGLDGLEAFYGKYSPLQTEQFLRLAEKMNLLVSGGSDYHGTNKPDTFLGKVYEGMPLPVDRVAALAARIAEQSVQAPSS